MSYLNINPANAPVIAQVSGSTFISTSGSVTAVVIGGSIGTGTFADVHSSIGDDAVSTSTDTLATSTYNYGFNQANGQWTRIFSVPRNSGDHIRVTQPTSGFMLMAASSVVGTAGDIAEVWSADDDAMFDTDNVLQVGARLYGFTPQGTSGVWPRVRITQSGQGISGIPHRLAIAFSGDVVQIGEGGDIVNVQNDTATDTVSTADNSLTTMSLTHAFNDQTNAWTRPRAIAVSSGMGIQSGLQMPFSGYFLGNVSILTDVGGRIVNAGNPNDDDTNPNEGALDTRSFTYGYTDHTSGWARIRALAVSSGQNQGSGLRMPFSGYFLGAASQIIDMAGTVVNVTPASDDDIEGVNLGMLDTMAKNYAYYDQQSGWARLRAIAVSSGMSGIGVPAQMPFSGYFLGTVSLIMDDDGVICDVQNSLSFTENATTSFLNTAATNYGRTPLSGELGAMQVTASGQGVSGIFHRAVIAFSGDIVQIGEGGNIVDVQSSTLSDAVSTADNSLTTMALGYAFHEMTGVSSGWSRLRSMVPTSGKGFALMTKPAEPVTYSVITPTITISSGRQFLAIYMTSGTRKVKIKAAHIHARSNLTSGQLVFMALTKITTNPLSGTALSATQFDETDEESGVSLTIKHTVTNIPDASTAQNLRIMPMTNQATINNIGAFSSGTATVILPNQFANSLNLADWGEGIKPFTLTSGVGVSIMQETTTTVTSGGFVAQIVYTLEDD